MSEYQLAEKTFLSKVNQEVENIIKKYPVRWYKDFKIYYDHDRVEYTISDDIDPFEIDHTIESLHRITIEEFIGMKDNEWSYPNSYFGAIREILELKIKIYEELQFSLLSPLSVLNSIQA